MQIECGSCDYKINQPDKLVSHYMTTHTLSHFDARHLVRVAEYTATLPHKTEEKENA
jgi:hypothetical protein